MAKKNNSCGVKGQENNAVDADLRPETSPYAGSFCKVFFGDGNVSFQIPIALLEKFPKLHQTPSFGYGPLSHRLPEIPESVGHVLIHFLYSGAYQCLRPKGTSGEDRLLYEFTTALNAYVIARKYELPGLAQHAQTEIERHGMGLNLAKLLSIIMDVYSNPKTDDKWFASYVRDRLKMLFSDPAEALAGQESNDGRTSIAGILLKSIVELRSEAELLEDTQTCGSTPTLRSAGAGLELAPLDGSNEALVDENALKEIAPQEDSAPREQSAKEDPVMEAPAMEEAVIAEPAMEAPAKEEPLAAGWKPAQPCGFGMETSMPKPAQPEPAREVTGSSVARSLHQVRREKKKKGKKALFSFDASGCYLRDEHLEGGLWRDCTACQAFVRRLVVEASEANI